MIPGELVPEDLSEALALLAAFTERRATGHVEIHISGGVVREVKTYETHKIRADPPGGR